MPSLSSTNSNKPVALISGANQGIGLATATLLAKQHDFHVIIGSRNPEAGSEAANKITAEGYSASSVQLDVGSNASILAAVAWIEKEFGKLDVLVNNAGVQVDIKYWKTDDSEEEEAEKHLNDFKDRFEDTFRTNLFGLACLTEACVPLLRKAAAANDADEGHGNPPKLIFVSSTMGSLTKATDKMTNFYNYDCRAYDTSKAAVNMLMINYARILHGVAKVNTVCPGLVKTRMAGDIPGASTPEEGASRIVELAVTGKDGPHETFSDKNGAIPW